MIWSKRTPLAVRGGAVHAAATTLAKAQRERMAPVELGEEFGAGMTWSSRWFRIEVPAPAAGERGHRHLAWICGGEATVWIDGEPWCGLDAAHSTCPLPDRACTLWIAHGLWATAIWHPDAKPPGPQGMRFAGCDLLVRNEAAWSAFHDIDVLYQALILQLKDQSVSLPAAGFGYCPPLERLSPLTRNWLRHLNRCCDAFDREGLPGLSAATAAAYAALKAESWQIDAALVGHAHLDLVWLWPESVTEAKGVHTFATQLRLMDRYPEFTFSQSQPALYRAIERQAPGQAKAIAKRIAEGRWEVMGGFEVEPDNNLPCGEALARSLVIGQEKTRALTGSISPVCWIPDVFGYNAMLPQLLRLGGVTAFFTTKMTWSAVNKFPYTSFVWKGADGSEVLTHLCPTGYNGNVQADELIGAAREHRQADVHPEVLLPIGYGDGGGGVTAAMCERARRFADLAGAPTATWTSSADFFKRLAKQRADLPVYQGELYLEFHRGTYTTQGGFKASYRAAERGLQTLEAVQVAMNAGPVDEAPWRRIAFAQFHDAIPGSSIGLVYEQMTPELDGIAAASNGAAAAVLAGGGQGDGWLVFNPLPFPRTAVVAIPGEAVLATIDGHALPGQRQGRGSASYTLVAVPLAALGSERVVAQPATADALSVAMISGTTTHEMGNGLVKATFDAHGMLAGLTVEGAALQLDGPCGFRLYDDVPAMFDAWDIDHHVADLGQDVATRMKLMVREAGPVRAKLRGESAIGKRSHAVVEWSIEAGNPFVMVDLMVDWHEDHRLLKFHVPTAYRGRWARYGAPFGSIQRSQQPGTSQDEAMWEVPGQRWAAVTDETGEGLALISEAKYGFSCREGNLGLSLLRAPTEPDPVADRGVHHIRFAIGRHERHSTGCRLATAAMADALYTPPVVVKGGSLMPPPFTLGGLGSLVPSWVQPHEDGFTLRLHEADGGRGRAELSLTAPARRVELIDFLGRKVGALPRLDPTSWALPYAPYQILSVRVTR